MDEPITFEENKRKAFRRMNGIFYRTPEEELQLTLTRFRRGETQAVVKEMKKKQKKTLNETWEQRNKFLISPRTIKHDCRNHRF
jgi:hypothetical protein